MMFPDIEKVLALALATRFGLSADHFGSTTPADLAGNLPFCQIVRYGGGDDGITDEPAVDIDWFDATRDGALTKARETHQFLLPGRHLAVSSLIDQVLTSVGPVERPRPEGNVRRFGGSYTVSTRRIRA